MSERSNSERRLTQRFGLNSPLLYGNVTLAGSLQCPLLDLSYGGFSAHLSAPEMSKEIELLPKTTPLEINLLGAKMLGEATLVFVSKERLGYSFCHESAAMLVFLRRFLEFMRLGSQLTLLDRNLVKEQYRGLEWNCFRGEGPVDVMLKHNVTSGSITKALVTFREREEYRSLSYREGKVLTHKSIDLSGVASRMAPTSGIDPDLARKVVCLLIGILQEKNSASGPVESLLEKIMKQLND
jgi:hypothetical protein